MRKKSIALLAALPVLPLIAANASASGDDPPVQAAATKKIVLGDDFFRPKTITVRKGTTLKFYWGDSTNKGTIDDHNVTAVKGNKFTNGEDTNKPDKPYAHKVTKTTLIVCTIHSTTMQLKVKVKK
jgi:plastocyanin